MKHAPFGVEAMLEMMEENWPEAYSPLAKLVMRVFRLRDLILEDQRKAMNRFDLSPVEFAVLSSLRKTPPPYQMRPSNLYHSTVVSSGGMTKLLKALEVRGLLERLPNPDDRRGTRVRLTSKGKTLIEQAMKATQASHKAFLERAADVVEVQELADALKRFTTVLDR